MPLHNFSHTVEEINGVKCSIVEKNIAGSRADFLGKLLEQNGFVVKICKAAPDPKASQLPASGTQQPETGIQQQVATPDPLFNLGVTDFTFNPAIAVFGKELKTFGGETVTPAFWNQGKFSKEEWYWKESFSENG